MYAANRFVPTQRRKEAEGIVESELRRNEEWNKALSRCLASNRPWQQILKR
jgi:hypothetical protein